MIYVSWYVSYRDTCIAIHIVSHHTRIVTLIIDERGWEVVNQQFLLRGHGDHFTSDWRIPLTKDQLCVSSSEYIRLGCEVIYTPVKSTVVRDLGAMASQIDVCNFHETALPSVLWPQKFDLSCGCNFLATNSQVLLSKTKAWQTSWGMDTHCHGLNPWWQLYCYHFVNYDIIMNTFLLPKFASNSGTVYKLQFIQIPSVTKCCWHLISHFLYIEILRFNHCFTTRPADGCGLDTPCNRYRST